MPARVHALLVVRPDGRVAADIHLERTLTALRAQSRPVDALTIVLCDADASVQAVAAASHAEAVISADRRTSFADALTLGRADAALAASIFHYGEIPIPVLKRELRARNIPVRL